MNEADLFAAMRHPLTHEPRQHDEGLGCSCGKDWPCPDAEGVMPAVWVDQQIEAAKGWAGGLDPALANIDAPSLAELEVSGSESAQLPARAPRKPQDRRTYLGGPDVAAIVGVSRYRAPIDVWRAKVEGVTQAQTERMAWGLLLESAIADGYSAQTGRRLQARRVPIIHKVYPFLGGSPDRWVVGEPGLLEIKAAQWLTAWADGPPADVEVQCQWYLGLTGRAWADVAVLAGLSSLNIWRIDRDDALIADLEAEAIAFWRDHVLTGVAPAPDASQAFKAYLSEKYPRASDLELVATAEQALMVQAFAEAKAQVRFAKATEQGLGNKLRAVIGEASALIGQGFRLTWRNSKDGQETDWQLVAGALRQLIVDAADYRIDLEAAIERADTIEGLYTVTKPGERRLHLRQEKGTDNDG